MIIVLSTSFYGFLNVPRVRNPFNRPHARLYSRTLLQIVGRLRRRVPGGTHAAHSKKTGGGRSSADLVSSVRLFVKGFGFLYAARNLRGDVTRPSRQRSPSRDAYRTGNAFGRRAKPRTGNKHEHRNWPLLFMLIGRFVVVVTSPICPNAI